MGPKKKRGAKTAIGIARATRSHARAGPRGETDFEQPEVKCPKKFGKFRCLVDPDIKMDMDDTPETTTKDEDTEEEIELADKLTNLEVSESLEEVIEDAGDLQKIVLHVENEDIVLECISEDVIPICGEQEDIVLSKEDSDGSNDCVREAPEDLPNSKDDVAETRMDVESNAELVKILEDKPSDVKKVVSEKLLIPSRKSTRISLKKSKSFDAYEVTKSKVPEVKNEPVVESALVKKGRKPKMKDIEDTETETSTTTSSEDSDEKKTSSEDSKDEDKPMAVKKGKKLQKSLKKKVLKKGPKISTKPGKKPVKLKLTSKAKQLLKKKKMKKEEGTKSSKEDENSIRRSNRIKTISSQKKTSKGKGLVKKEIKEADSDTSTSGNTDDKSSSRESPQFIAPNSGGDSDHKPVKVKSRWRRSSELEMNTAQYKTAPQAESAVVVLLPPQGEKTSKTDEEVERRLKQFVHLKENQYLTERISCKEAKKMTCDCFLTDEEMKQGEFGCGEDCLNRLLMIECGNLCTVGDRCTNKRFQKGQFAPCEVFRTDKKGLGIRASANIPYGEFILEYVGEVLDPDEFDARATEYSKDKNQHYYFMSLRADAVIDATQKGNISRFINHSCDPNAETQKWTVNGELRIGFFSKRTILAGEEITFDYQFQRYGKEAQKCFCEAITCRGWLGEEPEDEDEEEEEEDEEEEEEEVVKVVEVKDTAIVEEVKDLLSEEIVKVEGEIIENVEVVKEKSPKKEKKIKVLKPKRTRMDIFEDLDLDDEIETLQTTGLKNQAHTLKLSRLMVRAKETAQRTRLLKLLKRGELPCRRLFLDYHGLRLIHGWMTDAQHLAKTDNKIEFLRLEILQTLVMLPIPNKTMLQDSKVLPTVEKWAVSEKPLESPADSESNSPKSEADGSVVEIKEEPTPEEKVEQLVSCLKAEEEEADEFEIRRSVGMDVTRKPVYKAVPSKNIIEEIASIFEDDMDISPISFDEKEPNAEIKEVTPVVVLPKQDEYDVVVEILALATKLLEEWSVLKEVFRIPKKERIEQMKEHEREADRRFKALSLEQENLERKRENRYRSMQRSRSSDGSDSRSRKPIKNEDRTFMPLPQISKHERRKMFAMQVEQAEIDRRRKQQEMWQQHVKNCMMMGTDPRFTAPFDPNRGYHCIWNPQIGQWQNYPLPDQSMMFNQGVPHMPTSSFPYIPPPNMAPQPNMPRNIAPPHPMHPLSLTPQNPHNLHTPQNPHNLHPAHNLQTTQNPHNLHPVHNLPVPQSPHPVHNLHPPHNIPIPQSPHPNHNLHHNVPVSQSPHPNHNLHHNVPVPQSPHPSHNLHAPHNIPLPVPQSPHTLHHQLALPSPQNPHHPHTLQSPQNPHHTLTLPSPQNPHHSLTLPSPQNPHHPLTLPSPQNPHHPLAIPSQQNPLTLHPPPVLPVVQNPHPPPNLPQQNLVIDTAMPPHMHKHNVPPQTSLPPPNMHLQGNIPNSNIPQGMVPPNISQPSMQPANMGTMPPMPNIPPMPTLPYKSELDDPSQVKFAGPIPPPAKLPPKWKCAKDKYGRPYYYHIKIRKSQWEPPELPPEEEAYMSETTSSSDTSSLSSDSSSEDSDSDDIDDATLMLEIRNKFRRMEAQKKPEAIKKDDIESLEVAISAADTEDVFESKEETSFISSNKALLETLMDDSLDKDSGAVEAEDEIISSLDKRLIEELGLLKASEPPQKKRRVGLVQEIIISPRTEEDRLQFKEDMKKYKQNKEKLRKQKETIILQRQAKPALSPTVSAAPEASGSSTSLGGVVSGKTSAKSQKKKVSIKLKLKELEANSELSKKIKESFRSTMASVMVSILNAYRKPDCKDGRITNTEDFKHLARKLTHFVMLKELKHCQKIEELTCTESVKTKAKEFVRKYMSKFGETYQRPSDDLENY